MYLFSTLHDLSKEYLQNSKLAEVTDSQFGAGCSDFASDMTKTHLTCINIEVKYNFIYNGKEKIENLVLTLS